MCDENQNTTTEAPNDFLVTKKRQIFQKVHFEWKNKHEVNFGGSEKVPFWTPKSHFGWKNVCKTIVLEIKNYEFQSKCTF